MASAFQIDLNDVTIKDDGTEYGVDYVSIVFERRGDSWTEGRVYSNIEDIYPGYDRKKLEERFERFADRTRKAILAFLGGP